MKMTLVVIFLLKLHVGFVPKEDNPLIYEETEDGRLMLTIKAKIWKKYSQNFLEFFKRDGKVKPVSVEIQVFDLIENEDGTGEIKDFAYMAITVLRFKSNSRYTTVLNVLWNFQLRCRQVVDGRIKKLQHIWGFL